MLQNADVELGNGFRALQGRLKARREMNNILPIQLDPALNEPATREELTAYQFIIELIYDRCGIRLHEGKHHLIKARLGKRMRHHNIPTLPEYVAFLRSKGDEDELTHVTDALTTNFTHFLREEDHFKFLVKQGLPSALPAGQKRFKVWSAACSTGEEPYSICFYLAEHFPLAAGWDWSVLATDISTKVLAKAEQAVYAADRLSNMSPEWIPKYFQKGRNAWEGHYRIKPALTDRVTFKSLNLLGQYDFKDTFPVIFCRNVMIYFDRPTQEQLVKQLTRFLMPGGYLLVGHAESLTGLTISLKCLRPSIYQKI